MSRFNYIIPILISGILTFESASALSTDYYATSSRLATGRWVEIAVNTDGIQQFTYDQLRAMGFNNPAAVRVYGYGQTALFPDNFTEDKPDDLPQQPSLHHSDKLLFYGATATDVTLTADSTATRTRSPYSFESHYFLSDVAANDDNPASTLYGTTPSGNAVTSHTALLFIENERVNTNGHGTNWFDNAITASSPATYSVTLDGYNAEWAPLITLRSVNIDAGAMTLSINAAGASKNVSISKSSNPVYTTTKLRTGSTSQSSFDITVATTATSDFVAPDWLTVAYPRDNTLNGRSQLTMLLSNSLAGRQISLAAGVEVWDITTSTDVRRMAVNDNAFAFDADTDSWRRFVVFNPDATQPTPTVVGQVGNQNLHATATPEMLVIAATELLDKAREFADIHSDLDVAVVDASQIYREFGSGIASAPALRRFVKMLYDRNTDKDRLKYVMLVGNVSQDNRAIDRARGLLPTFECDVETYMHSTTTSFWSLAYITCVDDSYNYLKPYYGRPLAAVGIVPAQNNDQLSDYIAKVRMMMTPEQQRLRSPHDFLLMNDYGENGLFTSQINVHDSTLTAEIESPVIHKVYSDVYTAVDDDMAKAREDLIDRFGLYPAFMLYIGHAEYNFMTSSPYWIKSENLRSMKFPPAPIMFLSTCRTMSFDIHDTSIGAEFLLNPNCGATALIGSCRFSLSNHNQRFATYFTQAWITHLATPHRVGDIWLRAFNNTLISYSANTAGSINTHKYILVGDPAVTLPSVNSTIKADINSTIAAATATTLSGTTSITSGRVEAVAYADSTLTYMNGRSAADYKGYAVNNNDRRLWSANATVANGRFTIPVYLPTTALNADGSSMPIHITLRAWSDDDTQTARCAVAGLTLTAPSTTPAAPENTIKITSLDVTTDADGVSPSDITLTAAIDGGDTGLSTVSGTFKAPLEVRLDGKLLHSLTSNVEGNTINISGQLTGLVDGPHTVTLCATDNYGATDSAAVTFTVVNRSLRPVLTASKSIAHDSVTLTLDSDTELDDCHLIVTNDAEETVLSRQMAVGSTDWNLTDADNQRLAPGRYTLRVMARSARNYGASAPVSLTILSD